MHDQLESIVDAAYEAALVPELWPTVLEKVANLADAPGGVLFTADRNGVEWWTSAPATESVMHAFVSEGWMKRNTRAFRQISLGHQGFATDHDLYAEHEIAGDPLHNELLHRYGFGWAAGTVVQVPTGDLIIYNIERRRADGPFSREAVARLDSLRPHLARAGLIAARIGAERTKMATRLLGLVGLPAAVVGTGGGRLRAANDLFEALMPQVVREQRGRLRFVDTRADTLLDGALARLSPTAQLNATFSIPVPAREGRCPFVFHLVPVRGFALDVLPGSSLLLIVTPVSRPEVPSAAVIGGLFDLTPAEARVARAIAEGQSLRSLAAKTGVSEATLRVQLRSIFTKTGLNKQADLVAFLSGITIGSR